MADEVPERSGQMADEVLEGSGQMADEVPESRGADSRQGCRGFRCR